MRFRLCCTTSKQARSGAGSDNPPDRPLDQPDLQQFDDHVWPALAHRVPAFEALRVRSAWDGWYEVHPLDHNALLGPHPACANLVLACGFSGHGLQHAAAAGRGVAEWVLTGGGGRLIFPRWTQRAS